MRTYRQGMSDERDRIVDVFRTEKFKTNIQNSVYIKKWKYLVDNKDIDDYLIIVDYIVDYIKKGKHWDDKK